MIKFLFGGGPKFLFGFFAGIAFLAGSVIYFMYKPQSNNRNRIQGANIEKRVETANTPSSASSSKATTAEPPIEQQPNSSVVQTENVSTEQPKETQPIDSSSSSSSVAVAQETPKVWYVVFRNSEEVLSTVDVPSVEQYFLTASDEQNLSLRVTFPQKQVEEQNIKNWVTRVGDYIFARRLELIDDPGDVLRDPQLVRASSCSEHGLGCAVLDMKHEDWSIEIKGLENFPSELRTVVNKILGPTLANLDSIACMKPIMAKKMSTWLMESGKKLEDFEGKLLDGYIKMCTYDEKKSKHKYGEQNWSGFLPLVAWEAITNNNKEKIIELRNIFLNQFCDDVVGIIREKKLNLSEKSLGTIKKQNYEKLANKLKEWAKNAVVSNFLLESLVKNHQPHADGQCEVGNN